MAGLSALDIVASAPKGKDLIKSMQDYKETQPKSAIIDPTNYYGVAGVRSKPTVIPYATLRAMAHVPAISAVINTRLNQVARFARQPRFDGDLGFKITLKDIDKKMTEAEKKRAREIESFFLRTGSVPNSRRKDNFNQFLRKVVRDTLVLDAMVWEHVPNLKGEMVEIWAVDASTIEIVLNSPTSENFELPVYQPQTRLGQKIKGDIAYIQRIDGQIVAEFTEAEIAYAVRNPRTDLYYTDFGFSELEQLVEIVTAIVNGITYNSAYFTENSLPQGVLEIVGKYNDEHLEGFKRHWQTITSGAGGKWKVPVLAMEEGQGFKFTNFKNSNRDMEFNQFLEFLFNLTCAVYQIDPNEVGFKSWTSGQGRYQSDNTEVKMESSKDKGFVPLMSFLSDTFNSEIIDQIDPNFAFEWVGVDEENEDLKLERMTKKLSAGLTTVAEIRRQNDEDDILDGDGKPAKWTYAPANPQLLQVYMNEIQQEQQKEMMTQQQAMQAQQAQDGAQAPEDPQQVQQDPQQPKEPAQPAQEPENKTVVDLPKGEQLDKSLIDISWETY